MNFDRHQVSGKWEDFELLDSGDNMKLERYGRVIVARPETQALWAKKRPELWKKADASFAFGKEKGSWNVHKKLPADWTVAWNDVRLTPKLTSFKHTGIFPEQTPNWQWISDRVSVLQTPKVLNLFGYTGAASIAAAVKGAYVTHVDSSKQSLDWAHANAKHSGVPEDRIRWMHDDALAYVKRDVRRKAKYDGIILDPPAFGRGAKREVWRIEEDLLPLLELLKEIYSGKPGSFFLLNGYAAGYSARSFEQAIESVFGHTGGECGELYIAESNYDRVIPSGIYARFVC